MAVCTCLNVDSYRLCLYGAWMCTCFAHVYTQTKLRMGKSPFTVDKNQHLQFYNLESYAASIYCACCYSIQKEDPYKKVS